MARIYPSFITKESPRGERTVFSILNSHPKTNDWIVLHSFNLPDHGKRQRGEIDFVIMIPEKGVIALEVKSHDYIARVDGLWKYGNENPTRRSPFEQADSGMFAFRHRLGELSKGIPFCSAVAFTNTRFAEPAIEWKQWQVIDQADMQPDRFVEKLIEVAEENVRELRQMKLDHNRRASVAWFRPEKLVPSSELIDLITQTVRGDFEIHIDPRDLHKARESEYKQFLREQFEAIDAMSREQQILFEGAAGTGKTLLAIEETRRALSRGERVLFICYNRLLGKYISSSVEGEFLYSGTFHSFINQSAAFLGHAFPESPEDFLESTRKLRESRSLASNFDSIIVDEIQDFCSIGADNLLKEIIDQNPQAKVRLFGDFENQAVQFGHFVPRDKFIQKFGDIRTYPLTRNCRNRPGIGTAIELYTQKQDLYLGYRLPETKDNLRIVVANSEKDQLARCESEFLRLAKTYLPTNIVILGLTREVSTKDLSGNLARALTNDYSLWKDAGSRALSTTVRRFKGLDAQAVILTYLPDSPDMDLLYTGMSRAIEEVVLVAPQVVLARFVGIPSL
jgi:hypothetical protein